MSDETNNPTTKKKLCDAINCNELANTGIEFNVDEIGKLTFKVCIKCKEKFFNNNVTI